MHPGITGRFEVTVVGVSMCAPLCRHRQRIKGLGRAAANALRVFDALRRRPVADIDHLARQTGVAYPTAARAVDALVRLGVARELTGRRRGRVFAYDGYLAILNEGAQPL